MSFNTEICNQCRFCEVPFFHEYVRFSVFHCFLNLQFSSLGFCSYTLSPFLGQMWSLRLREGKCSFHSHAARLLVALGFKHRYIPHQPESFSILGELGPQGGWHQHTQSPPPPTFQSEFCSLGPCPSLCSRLSGPGRQEPHQAVGTISIRMRRGGARQEASFLLLVPTSAPDAQSPWLSDLMKV